MPAGPRRQLGRRALQLLAHLRGQEGRRRRGRPCRAGLRGEGLQPPRRVLPHGRRRRGLAFPGRPLEHTPGLPLHLPEPRAPAATLVRRGRGRALGGRPFRRAARRRRGNHGQEHDQAGAGTPGAAREALMAEELHVSRPSGCRGFRWSSRSRAWMASRVRPACAKIRAQSYVSHLERRVFLQEPLEDHDRGRLGRPGPPARGRGCWPPRRMPAGPPRPCGSRTPRARGRPAGRRRCRGCCGPPGSPAAGPGPSGTGPGPPGPRPSGRARSPRLLRASAKSGLASRAARKRAMAPSRSSAWASSAPRLLRPPRSLAFSGAPARGPPGHRRAGPPSCTACPG